MQYLLLIYEREADWNSMGDKEKGAIFQEYMAFTQGIMKSGHHRAGDALQPVSIATTVRVRNGKEVGAQYVGIVQSLIASCRLQGIDPYVRQ